MKYTSLFLLVMTLTLSSEAQPFSPYDWATYYALKKTQDIKIDGELEDWKEVKGFSLDQEKYFFVGQGMSSSKWKGVTDLSGNFKVQWDEAYIYIAIEVWDDKVTTPHGALVKDNTSGSWDDDGIEIMFDHDGCGKSRYYVGDLMHHEYHFVYDDKTPFVFDNFWVPDVNAAQPMFTLPNGDQEPLAYAGETMSKNNVTESFSNSPYYGNYRFKRTQKGYNLELKMKLPGTVMKPINNGGHKIGFDICINDNDEGKDLLKQQLHWSGMNGIFWRDCKYFGTLILLER
ncbi:MAG: sugar-binding protein [Chryseolinea sp.]